MAAQVVTVTMTNPEYRFGFPNKITINCTTATGGTVSQEICAKFRETYPSYPEQLQGFITRVVTNPGATAPTDDYDLTLLDEDGVDVLDSLGLNRDTATSEQLLPAVPIWIDGTLTVTLATAGDEKVTKIVIYMLPG